MDTMMSSFFVEAYYLSEKIDFSKFGDKPTVFEETQVGMFQFSLDAFLYQRYELRKNNIET